MQTTNSSAIGTVMQFRSKSCVTWHINLSSAHAHHCLKKEKANYSVLVRSTASESPVMNTSHQSLLHENCPLLREKLEEGETRQHRP